MKDCFEYGSPKTLTFFIALAIQLYLLLEYVYPCFCAAHYPF